MLKKYHLIILAVLFLGLILVVFLQKRDHHQPLATAEADVQKSPELMGHWTFDEPDSDIVYDQSSYQSHGEIKGNPAYEEGIVGRNAMEFDGEGDYVEMLKNGKTPSHIQNLSEGSIAVWFKARNIPVGKSILPVFYYGNKNGCPNMFDASNEGLIIEIAHGSVFPKSKGVFFTIFSNPCDLPSFCYDSHSDVHLSDQQGAIKEGEWYHFVTVVGKDYNTGYLNGKEIDYRQYNFNTASASEFFADAVKHERMWVGKGYWDHATEVYFDGYIDDLRIYDKPLSKSEVQRLYNMKDAG